MRGKVIAVIRDKGFGFIQDEHGDERFFHHNNLRGTSISLITEGTEVEFEPYEGGKRGNGKRAEAVTVVQVVA